MYPYLKEKIHRFLSSTNKLKSELIKLYAELSLVCLLVYAFALQVLLCWLLLPTSVERILAVYGLYHIKLRKLYLNIFLVFLYIIILELLLNQDYRMT